METMRALTISLAFLALIASACGSVTTTGGAGGQTGAGGSGTGGNNGTGGGTGDSCAQLESQYSVELAKAKTCSPNASNQCQEMASTALACGCPTYVNDKSALDQLQSRWDQAGCQNSSTVCPALACVSPRGATCRASDGGSPSCVDTVVAP